MAVSKNFFGIRRGQAAGLVFQGNFNAKGVAIQVTRGQAESIANPQSYGQAQQRSRMAAVSKLASIFARIIDHSVEGLRFGQPNRSRFMADCLKATSDAVYTGPYMTKGDTSVKLPNGFVVELSKGSLPEIPVTLASTVVPATELTATIMADFSLETGDILTLVLVREDADGKVAVGYKQVVVRVGADLTAFGASFVAANSSAAAHLEYPSSTGLAEVLVVHERNTGSVYKRSTSYLHGFADVPTQTEASIASYMSENSKRVYFGERYLDGGEISDRYIDKVTGAGGGAEDSAGLVAVYVQNRTETSPNFGKWVRGLGMRNADGSYSVFKDDGESGEVLVSVDGGSTTYEANTLTGTVQAALAGSSTAAQLDNVDALTAITATWRQYDPALGHL